MKVKKGDTVKVIAGKDRGKEGQITRVLLDVDRVLVDGANMVKRHQKAKSATSQGGIIDKEMPIHVSNVMIVCKSCGPTAWGTPAKGAARSASVASAERTSDGRSTFEAEV